MNAENTLINVMMMFIGKERSFILDKVEDNVTQ